MAGSRVFVQEEIYDQFVEQVVRASLNRKVGDPFELFVENGPLIS